MERTQHPPSQPEQHEGQGRVTKIKMRRGPVKARLSGHPAARQTDHQCPMPQSQWQVPNQLGALV